MPDPNLKVKITTESDVSGATKTTAALKDVGAAATKAGQQTSDALGEGTKSFKDFSTSGVEAGHIMHNLEIASQGGVRGFIALARAGKDAAKLFGGVILANPILAAVAAVGLAVAGFVTWKNKVDETTKSFEELRKENDTLKDHTEAMVASSVAALQAVADKLKEISDLYGQIDADISQNIAHNQELLAAQKELDLAKLAPGDASGKAAIEKKYSQTSASNRVSAAQLKAGAASSANDSAQAAFGQARGQRQSLQTKLADARDVFRNAITDDDRNAARDAIHVLEAQLKATGPEYEKLQGQASSFANKSDVADKAVGNAQEIQGITNQTAALRANGAGVTSGGVNAAYHRYNIANAAVKGGDDSNAAANELKQATDAITALTGATVGFAKDIKKQVDTATRQLANMTN